MELNQRVTFPVKRIIRSMDASGVINMDCPTSKFCVFSVLCRVCEVGMWRMIDAWNSHSIPHRGVPNTLQSNQQLTMIHPAEIPHGLDATALYRAQGGRLTDARIFGVDPLGNDISLCQSREEQWGCDVAELFSAVMMGNSSLLEQAIQDFIDLTNRLSP